MARRWRSGLGGNLPREAWSLLAGWRAGLMPSGIRERWMPMGAPSEFSARALTSATRRRTRSCTKEFYDLLSEDQPVHIDDLVERSGLNSSEVLATLFTLEMKGIIRQLPGKQFCKVLL